MSRQQAHRQRRAIVAAIVSTMAFGGITQVVRADTAQNTAASASNAQLTTAGFGGYNGNGITIGQNETGLPNYSGNAIGSAMLPNGNPNLPGNVSWLAGGGTNIRNHATEVAGVIASTIANQNGVAIGANVLSANTSDITIGIVGTNYAGSWGSLNMQKQFQQSSIINMSWGGTGAAGATFVNNGNYFISPFVDFQASANNSLVIVAGNERKAEAPSDAYNILNVGALGIRTGTNYGTLSYNTFATYNTTNATNDGRIGVALVAPGGDPGSTNLAAANGTFNALPAFNNQFITTAGGQFHYAGTTGGNPIYDQDTFNGASTASYGYAVDTNAPFVAGPPFARLNPGTNLGGSDQVSASQLAGTSFAAPLVSGAAAVLEQYGTAFRNNTNFASTPSDALDHRVLKAILMNGASNTNPDGSALTYYIGNTTNTTQYTQAPIQTNGGPIVKNIPAAYFGSGTVYARSGLDATVGAGEMNLVNSLKNYAAGEQGIGVVNPTGWNFTSLPSNTNVLATYYVHNYDFTIGSKSGEFDATLAWDSNVSITANAGSNATTWQPGSTSTASSTLSRAGLTDLDLYLCKTNGLEGQITQILSYSTSIYDNDQHIFYPSGLDAGTYELDVVEPNQPNATGNTPYGLAWATLPEPALMSFVMFGSILLLARKRKSKFA